MPSLDLLFAPASVAIVGDSPAGGRGAVMRGNLERLGYRGSIYPINPKYQDVNGRRCYPSLSSVGESIDAVLVAVSANHAVNAVQEAADVGVKAAVVIASGFAEDGPGGRVLEDSLIGIATTSDMAICGPNCYGVLNFAAGYAGYGGPAPLSLRPGHVALLLQSGALSHSLLNPASARGLALSHVVTTGNEAVIQLGTYVEHAVADPDTHVIACFIEGVRDPTAFADAVVHARLAGKPVVVCKTGRSKAAGAAAIAHTGAMVGNDAAFDALCEASGVIRVDDLDELIEACLLLSTYSAIRPPFLLTSVSGGGSGLMADIADAEGLPLADLSADTVAHLSQVLPTFANVNNPLDLTGAVGERPDLVTSVGRVLERASEVGTVVLGVNASTADTTWEREVYAKMLGDMAAGAGTTPVVGFTMTSGYMDKPLLEAAQRAQFPLLMGMKETLTVLARATRADSLCRDWRPPSRTPSRAERLVALSEAESSRLLADAGLTMPAAQLVSTVDEAVGAATRLGFPVVIKADCSDIPHKAELGCVALGLTDASAVAAAADRVLSAARAAAPGAQIRLLVAEEVGAGVDLIIGGLAEPGVGHLLLVGLGGVFAEALSGVHQQILAPASRQEALELLNCGAMGQLLAGYRGAPPADIDAAADAVVTVSNFLTANPQIQELDINPLRVLARGAGTRVLDGLVVVNRKYELSEGDPA